MDVKRMSLPRFSSTTTWLLGPKGHVALQPCDLSQERHVAGPGVIFQLHG